MYNWIIIILFLGAIQGFFLAAILASKHQGTIATKVLAVMMLVFSVDLIMAVYQATDYHEIFPHFLGMDYPLTLLYGPLFYLYAKTLSNAEDTFRRSNYWHFLPFILLLGLMLPFYIQSGDEKLLFLGAEEPNLWTQLLDIISHVKLLHAVAYLGITINLLKQHRQQIKHTFSSTERINLIWLRNLMIGFGSLAGISVVVYILGPQDTAPAIGIVSDSLYANYPLLGLSVFVYAVGFMGLRQPEIFDSQLRKTIPASSMPGTLSQEETHQTEPPTSPVNNARRPLEKLRYEKSGMDKQTAEQYKQELLELINTEKLYQRGNLTLHDLSNALSFSSHNLTEVLNTQFGLTFYDFINGYRVREVQERLANPKYAHYTLLAVGMDAGFNSKSSFNTVFKKHTGMTPSQYKQQAVELK